MIGSFGFGMDEGLLIRPCRDSLRPADRPCTRWGLAGYDGLRWTSWGCVCAFAKRASGRLLADVASVRFYVFLALCCLAAHRPKVVILYIGEDTAV